VPRGSSLRRRPTLVSCLIACATLACIWSVLAQTSSRGRSALCARVNTRTDYRLARLAAVGPSFPGRWPRPLPPEALRPGLGGAMRAPPLQLAAQLHARCTSRLEGRLVWRCPRVAQRVRSRGPRPAEGALQVRLGRLRHVDDARKGRRETVAGFSRRPAIPPIATCRQTRVDCPGSGSPLLPTGLGCCHTDRPGTRGVCVRRLGQHVRALHTGDASHGSAQPAPSFSRSHLSSPKPCPGFSNHG
jgi:hypothetical protein